MALTCGTSIWLFFDNYLLHCVDTANYEIAKRLDTFAFLSRMDDGGGADDLRRPGQSLQLLRRQGLRRGHDAGILLQCSAGRAENFGRNEQEMSASREKKKRQELLSSGAVDPKAARAAEQRAAP